MRRKKASELYKKVKSMERAIKLDCYDCMGGQKKVDCGIEDCSLYPFRPYKKKCDFTEIL